MKFEELEKFKKYNNTSNFIPLHCVSIYPLSEENSNFAKFEYLKKNFKKVDILVIVKG